MTAIPGPCSGEELLLRLKGECRQTTCLETPPAHLLRRFLLDRFSHMRSLRELAHARRAPPSILRYYTNKGNFMDDNSLTIHLGQPAEVVYRVLGNRREDYLGDHASSAIRSIFIGRRLISGAASA